MLDPHAAIPLGLALMAIVLEVILAGVACADPLWWLQPYRTHGGGGCCGEVKCVPATTEP
jgi:hypothetical protein